MDVSGLMAACGGQGGEETVVKVVRSLLSLNDTEREGGERRPFISLNEDRREEGGRKGLSDADKGEEGAKGRRGVGVDDRDKDTGMGALHRACMKDRPLVRESFSLSLYSL
jgi:hypothetical protein